MYSNDKSPRTKEKQTREIENKCKMSRIIVAKKDMSFELNMCQKNLCVIKKEEEINTYTRNNEKKLAFVCVCTILNGQNVLNSFFKYEYHLTWSELKLPTVHTNDLRKRLKKMLK